MAIDGTGGSEHRVAAREREAFLEALQALDRALDENIARAQQMKRRIAQLQTACASERPIREIVSDEDPPLVVQLLTENADALHEYGSAVRRTEARVLHREGLAMEEIARLFGVSRQRISALLRDS